GRRTAAARRDRFAAHRGRRAGAPSALRRARRRARGTWSASSGSRGGRGGPSPPGASSRRAPSPPSASRSASKSSAQVGSYSETSTRSEGPLTVFLDDVAVALDAAAVAEVLDHVPVDARLVLAADRRDPRANREMDRPVHLLVEERVLHVALDPGVAADAELPEHASALVAVELGEQRLLVRGRRGTDDLAVAVDYPHALD